MSKPTLLPPNATALERHLEQVTARIEDVPLTPLGSVWNPATCDAALLPWLAWALSVPEWSSSWPEDVQRATIAAAVAVRKTSGTTGALRRALEAMRVGVELTEWFDQDPIGEPGTAKAVLQLETFGIPEEDMNRMDRAINRLINVRSRLDFTIALTGRLRSSVAVAQSGGEAITVGPQWAGRIESLAANTVRTAMQSGEVVEITPRWTRIQSLHGPAAVACVSQSSEVLSVRPPFNPLLESVSEYNAWYGGFA